MCKQFVCFSSLCLVSVYCMVNTPIFYGVFQCSYVLMVICSSWFSLFFSPSWGWCVRCTSFFFVTPSHWCYRLYTFFWYSCFCFDPLVSYQPFCTPLSYLLIQVFWLISAICYEYDYYFMDFGFIFDSYMFIALYGIAVCSWSCCFHGLCPHLPFNSLVHRYFRDSCI